MSNAFKCDRCGGFFEPGDQGKIKNSPYGVWKGNVTADLCPMCSDELYEWYKNPEGSRPIGYWMNRVTAAAREAFNHLKETEQFKAAVEAAAEQAKEEQE